MTLLDATEVIQRIPYTQSYQLMIENSFYNQADRKRHILTPDRESKEQHSCSLFRSQSVNFTFPTFSPKLCQLCVRYQLENARHVISHVISGEMITDGAALAQPDFACDISVLIFVVKISKVRAQRRS